MKILSLSGGGFKGFYTINVLAGLEESLGYPIANKFDLIAGTSIGGIIALALAYEIPCKDIVTLFRENANLIFKRRFSLGLCIPKYNNKELKKILVRLFGDKKIKDLKHRILIPTVNYSKGAPQIFKTRHHEDFKVDYKRHIVDVAMATSAAPIYFSIYHKSYGDFVDGGLVANHPGLFAFIEAKEFLKAREDDISILHIGTLSQKFTSSGSTRLGLLGWSTKLLSVLFSCQETSVNQILKIMLGDRYYVIDNVITENQSKKIGLDKTKTVARCILKQQAEESVKQFLGTDEYMKLKNYTAEPFKPIPID